MWYAQTAIVCQTQEVGAAANTVQKRLLFIVSGNHQASHFKTVLFSGHNHMLATSTDDPTL